MFRAIILPIFRSTRLCVTACGIMHCNTQSSAPEDGQNNCPKHVELTGNINKPLLLHLIGCLYYLYQWSTVKQIPDNEIYLLIKYIKSVPWRVAKRLSYIEDARCLKVKYYYYSMHLCFSISKIYVFSRCVLFFVIVLHTARFSENIWHEMSILILSATSLWISFISRRI